ncbi:SPOR domain-containing protein [uncultured Roseovarius sp.]|uniref:SPOR domain-containing protein n=1 Tax=uncultured Roseovarius sp. TaxID=293344 RepID=UPI00260A4EF5|nr:SPOR domain-containing protein [uncultured Roseovarius sp.]
MADMQYAQPEAGRERANVVAKITNITGAALSLALIAGVGIWGYKMVMRDVSGVPVVRAAEGPMRIAPSDPGGRAAEHQGLAVNAVAADGTASPPADRLVLAPPPLDLTLDDVPDASQAADARAHQLEATPMAEAEERDPTAQPEEIRKASVLALADQIAAGAPVLSALDEEDTVTDDASGGEAAEAAVKVVEGGIGRSLRPRPRPASLSSMPEAVATAVAAARSVPAEEVDAASIPLGTRLAQLGAFDSAQVARSEWDEMLNRFGDFIEGKQRVIQRAESGGRTFYRLRAMGFDDLGDARRFCSALVAEGADCIPVVTR